MGELSSWLSLNLKSISELKLFFYLDLSGNSLPPTPAKSRQPTQVFPLYIHTSFLYSIPDKAENYVVSVLFNNSFDAVINFKKKLLFLLSCSLEIQSSGEYPFLFPIQQVCSSVDFGMSVCLCV